MLHDFLTNNRGELVARCQAKAASREHAPTIDQLQHGVPMFLDQLIVALRSMQGAYSGAAPPPPGLDAQGQDHADIGASATLHGRDMLDLGMSVDEVVHNYGDLCQAITGLAVERDAPFTVDEFRTLNGCLDVAIAHAVTAFGLRRDSVESDRLGAEENKRMGFFVHELRNLLGNAKLAFDACAAGGLPLAGATGSILSRSLAGMEVLINGSIAQVREEHLHGPQSGFPLADFVAEIEATAALAAVAKGCRLRVPPMDPQLRIHGNRATLLAAVINLLQNAMKYTQPHTEVTLTGRAAGGSILIEVGDHCGGIGADLAQRMFQPFEQGGADRSGLGLGLSIARQFVEDNGGALSVRDLPGTGCVFTVTLPLGPPP